MAEQRLTDEQMELIEKWATGMIFVAFADVEGYKQGEGARDELQRVFDEFKAARFEIAELEAELKAAREEIARCESDSF